MLLALIVCATLSLSSANPFHKYPYIYLLDVGNEELEKTNTEQLRVSIPGGSLAMKYPVLGEGDTISHVRVSGIDFGTDLKVNIVEGGPGYKYVVLVFMGNPGVSYDAVVTLQTLPNGMDVNTVDESQIINTKSKVSDNYYEVSDTDSDADDDDNDKSIKMKSYEKKSKSEVMQSSSTFYNYANANMAKDDDSEESEDNNTSAEEEDDDNVSDEEGDGQSSDEESSDDEDEESGESVKEHVYFKANKDLVSPRAEQYTYNVEDSSNSDYRPPDILDDSLYEKYQDLKPHFGDGFKVYPQSSFYNKQYQVSSSYDNEDPVELEQMFNDEEVHNDGQYNDGSNSIDSDYGTAEY